MTPKKLSTLPKKIIGKYYTKGTPLYDLLVTHSKLVSGLALEIADAHPAWEVDRTFLYEAAMLHDVGIFLTDAPSIGCTGTHPYVLHGILGAELLREEGYPKHALVCERHTGVGLTLQEIVSRGLPLPAREMVPVSLEEQIICYADCFYSKSGDPKEKRTVERILSSFGKRSEDQVLKFRAWHSVFSS